MIHPASKCRKPRIPLHMPLRMPLRILFLFLLARSRLFGAESPFACAFFCAAMSTHSPPLPLLAGCAAAALVPPFSAGTVLSFFSCALAAAFHGLCRLIFGIRIPRRDDACALIACFSQLLPALILSGGLTYNVLSALLNALCAAALAPALCSALLVKPSRRLLLHEEQLSCALTALLLLISLCAVPRAGTFLSRTAAALMTLILSFCGCGMGALAGVGAGSALRIGGADPFIGAALSLSGVLAGCVREAPRPLACLAFASANLLSASWGLGYSPAALEIPVLLTACLLYCLIPLPLLRRIRLQTAPRPSRIDPERLAVRIRRKAARRLGEIGGIFGELADGYGEASHLPTEGQLIARMKHTLCSDCEHFADCRSKGNDSPALRLCRQAAQTVLTCTDETNASLPDELISLCRRPRLAKERLLPLLKQLAKDRREHLKRGESRSLTARQFREAQNILESLSTRLNSEICLNGECARIARAALDRAGIRCRDVLAVLDDRIEIVCTLREGTWDGRRARLAADLLSGETGIPFTPLLNHGRIMSECELYLVQCPALTARFFAASMPMEDGMPCGDAHTVQQLPDGRFIAALSDGMGSGEEAARESRRCICLLRKFVSAGIDRDAALTAVNQLMMMCSGDEMFATADLCIINLYSGIASFSKLGACRSFLLQEKGIRQIAGGRLPLGILDRVDAASASAEVFPGDLLIMISDGVADEMKDGQITDLLAMLPSLRTCSPKEAVERILDRASHRDGTHRSDDMTVIAVRILERKPPKGVDQTT